jgi:hypothetical protein
MMTEKRKAFLIRQKQRQKELREYLHAISELAIKIREGKK